ncbi:hypothetical protein AX14_009411 [Amanita brunnescens Koide BX004]|nr:hypothetical protein AX14_009411 [Amanita brunnescens Koide BX004]
MAVVDAAVELFAQLLLLLELTISIWTHNTLLKAVRASKLEKNYDPARCKHGSNEEAFESLKY